jgi:hypothetical protein
MYQASKALVGQPEVVLAEVAPAWVQGRALGRQLEGQGGLLALLWV